MKIEAIRGQNMASLEKEFEIDFTCDPLKSAGLFAITGNTGSGKSTILDALCIALFDTSPRILNTSENIWIPDVSDKTINQRDSRTVLRRGAISGYAEVDFISLGGERFRSRWSVKRAYNKIEGALQNSEIQLTNLTKGREEQGRKTELLQRISGLIGLTFEQFTRSVLLAQGDFATFLKAKESEKAELLEKLTGTDIYSRISKTIYEKTKNAETLWNIINEKIKSIEVLSDEDALSLNKEKNNISASVGSLKEEIEKLTSEAKWIEEKIQLTKDIALAESALSKASNNIKEAKSRFYYISLYDTTQEIRDTYLLLDNTKKQITDSYGNLKSATKQRDDNSVLLNDASGEVLKIEKEQEQLNEKQREIAPQIIRARELDIQLVAAKTNLEEAIKEEGIARQSKDKTEKNISAINLSIKTTSEQSNIVNEWIKENKSFEAIIQRTELLVNLISDLETIEEQKTTNQNNLKENNFFYEKNIKQIEKLKEEQEHLNAILPIEISELRKKLIDGEPCPVCGSLHHPTTNPDSEQEINDKELKLSKEKNAKSIEALTNDIERRKNDITRLSALIENYNNQYNNIIDKLNENLSIITGWKELFNNRKLKSLLIEKSNQWVKYNDDLVKLQDSLRQSDTNLQNEILKLTEYSDSLTVKTEKRIKLNNTLQQLTAERMQALRGKPAEAAEKYFIEQQDILSKKAKKAAENKTNAVSKQESVNGIISRINIEIKLSEEKAAKLKEETDCWLTKNTDISDELLSELLKTDINRIKNEKNALNKLLEEETRAKATLTERKKVFEQHQNKITKPEEPDIILDMLIASIDEKNNQSANLIKRLTEIEVALSSDIKAKEQIKKLDSELKSSGELFENWKKLNHLLGSANGNKFKEIAQGYTLEFLLSYANKHLNEFSPRYKLLRIPDTLALQVVDLDMLNEIRTVHSLSGGESFLISLALALGLSSLSSNRMKVESLFIDEGFGSLDNETLRAAMDALENLQTLGRKIGVISHVAEMNERIPVQIRVIKTSNGKSEIQISG